MIKVRITKLPQARTGYQVQGALVNDVPAMGGADYDSYLGKPKLKESKYITAVPRDEANLEAEGGETVYGDLNGDGFPEHKIIKGPRHHSGGVPLNLPDDTFIFSDTRGMKIKDPEILEMFGKAGSKQAYTPASLAKQYDIQKYRKILEDPESDHLDRKTAELMLKNFVIKLGCLALAQEAKKGFPQGIPAVAKPCMDAKGITPEAIGPEKSVLDLTQQIKTNYKLDQNAEETMESEDQTDDVAQAEQMNQGQPVAQAEQQMPPQQQMQQPSPEEMMMYGGNSYRRLRRAQEGMEQAPQEMMEEPEQEGDDQIMEIIQEVSAALEQGTEPEEIIISLLENEVPPEVIVEIFMQLGASEEEAVGLIQGVIEEMQGGGQEQMMSQQPRSEEEAMMMQQQAPMAQYGMSMGGYDMPFYDDYEEEVPEAEYGMSMGNRPKPISRFGSLPKAGNGIIKRSEYPVGPTGDAQFDEAVYTAYITRQNLPDTDPKKTEKIQVIGADGKTKNLKDYRRDLPTETGALDMDKWGNTTLAKTSAAQYYMLTESLKDPNSPASKKLWEETTNSLKNEKHFRSASSPDTPTQNWEERGYTLPSQDEVIKSFLKHQERNLLIQAKGIDGQLYTNTGRGFASWNDKIVSGVNVKGVKSLLAAGDRVTDPRDPTGETEITSEADLLAAQQFVKETYGGSNVSDIASKLGVPFETGVSDRALQQATFHGYANITENLSAGSTGYYDPKTQYNLRNFVGNMQSGVSDETSMAPLYPHSSLGARISPIDDFRPPSKSIYGNTTMKHMAAYNTPTPVYEDDVTITEPPKCQCEDETQATTYGTLNKETGKCDPALCNKPCPCVTTDANGVDTTITQERLANGDCPPCEKEEDYDVEGPPAEWWLQDTIKTTGAFADLMGVKKYMPWAPGVDLQKPRPTFLDPTRELAANAEQANIQTQGVAQFAGPQALSARSSGIQGQAAKNAADVLSKYNNANVNLANQFELKGTDVANQESMLKQATSQRLYDQNTVANQQYDNSKLAMKNNLRNYYTNAITNKWQTDALNQMYPNYAVSPASGGRMNYKPGSKQFTGQGSGTGTFDWQKAHDECVKANQGAGEKTITSCIAAKEKVAASNSYGGANSNVGMGMYGTQRKQGKNGMIMKKGGESNTGYLNLDSWLPFLM
jgi:hypothetical protein